MGAGTSFNRYMVECECVLRTQKTKKRLSFNRYMVECELAFLIFFICFPIVLIDTWWNVNTSI